MWTNWSRNEKIGGLSLVVAIIGTMATVAVIPEVRELLISRMGTPRSTTLTAMIFRRTESSRMEIDENQLRQLCERRLRPGDLTGMTLRELELLRNGIFAIHGRSFARRDLREIFSSQAWYRSDPTYDDGRLTTIDTYNVGVILKAERSARANGGT